MPYEPSGNEHDLLADYPGDLVLLAGSDDATSTPDMVEQYLLNSDNAHRAVFLNLTGLGHQASTDLDFGEGALSESEQLAVTLAVTEPAVQASIFGDDAQWDALLCGLTPAVDAQRAHGAAPLLWGTPLSSAEVAFSLSQQLGAQATLYVGRGPGETDTPQGVVGLRTAEALGTWALDDGFACPTAAIPTALEGLAWAQVAFESDDGSVIFSEAVDLFGVGDPGPLEDEGGDDPGGADGSDGTDGTDEGGTDEGDLDGDGDAETEAASGSGSPRGGAGCAVSPGTPGVVAGLVALLAVARRRR